MATGGDSFIGEIALYPYYFTPDDWALCDGTLRPITMANGQPDPLYALIGTTFGGDGQKTYAVPNLNERAVLGAGNAPLLSPAPLGAVKGEATVILNPAQTGHEHKLQSRKQASDADKTPGPQQAIPPGHAVSMIDELTAVRAMGNFTKPMYVENGTLNKLMHPAMIGSVGGDQPHENMQPYLALKYFICVDGVFPT